MIVSWRLVISEKMNDNVEGIRVFGIIFRATALLKLLTFLLR